MRSYLDFEKPVAEIEAKVAELRALESSDSAAAFGEEISRLEAKAVVIPSGRIASTTSRP
jgi:acetyl-CoA carboxylase carboxyl transferase subunit alpha